MYSYEQTLDTFQEMVSLGYSASEAIRQLEDDENANSKALEELRDAQKNGI